MRFTLEEILNLTCARVQRWPFGGPGSGAPPLQPIDDARNAGLSSLWFSMRPRELGPDVISHLAQAGAAGVVLFRKQPVPKEPRLGVLTVNSPAEAYYHLAQVARARAGSPVAGVTGSTGKTSTKEYLRSLLQRRYRVAATENSFNQIDDCATLLLQLEGRGDAAVIEMGFGAVGNMDAMGAMARPSAGIILNVTPGHFDGAGSMEIYAREKGKLGRYLPPHGLLVINGEDPGCGLIDRTQYRCTVATFGFTPGHDAVCENVTVSEQGTAFTLRMHGQRIPIQLQAFGDFQAANAAAAALVAHAAGLSPQEIQEALAEVPPLPRRFVIHPFSHGLTLIDDTWHATVEAMKRGLENAVRLAGGRRKVAVLGSMPELEQMAEHYHREVGAHAVALGFSDLLAVGEKQQAVWIRDGAVEAGLPADRVHLLPEFEAAGRSLLPFARPDTVIYCKSHRQIGSHLDAFRAAVAAVGFEPRERGR